jgi:ascorbate-specific PTS system EIIC-type component UlaA
VLEASVVGLLIAFPVVGILTRRWIAVVLPLIGWPIFYMGINRGWWLDGTGDGWQAALTFFTVIGVASTALAVVAARRLGSRQSRDNLVKPS